MVWFSFKKKTKKKRKKICMNSLWLLKKKKRKKHINSLLYKLYSNSEYYSLVCMEISLQPSSFGFPIWLRVGSLLQLIRSTICGAQFLDINNCVLMRWFCRQYCLDILVCYIQYHLKHSKDESQNVWNLHAVYVYINWKIN